MGEAIITSRTGSVGSGSSGSSGGLKTEIFTESGYFLVPKAKNQSFSVRIFGGGGSGSCSNNEAYSRNKAGGCGGFMNNGILTLNEGEAIPVTIGRGGKFDMAAELSGGGASYATQQNDYVALYNMIFVANSSNMAFGITGEPSFFGNYLSANGGSGGGYGASGRGGSVGGFIPCYNGTRYSSIAYQFGGGGTDLASSSCNGGKWGGGGGGPAFSRGGCLYENSQNISEITGYSGLGGNGKGGGDNGENGTNISGVSEINNLFETAGTGGTDYGGGGGYGGCGGNNYGGGGGYGANGGNYCGGGGGYGKYGKGGDYYGGGGAYGPGGDGVYSSSMIGSNSHDGKYGGGGGAGQYTGKYGRSSLFYFNNKSQFPGNGGDGICIIQYYPV
mgnify:CR=1 FL=1